MRVPRTQKRRFSRRAAAMVEFAIILPIMMLFFTGLAEIARVLMLQHTADTAAYEGARSAMVPGATADEAIAATKQLLDAADIKNTLVRISPDKITESTPLISVEVQIPLANNSWIPNLHFINLDVVSEVTLFCERPPMIRLTGLPKLKAKKAKLKNEILADDELDDG